MPGWVHSELSKLIFKFFWKGKPDLVARVVVTQPMAAGGFSVVDIKFKVFLSSCTVGSTFLIFSVWLGLLFFILVFCSSWKARF